jgi:hypothetical protein
MTAQLPDWSPRQRGPSGTYRNLDASKIVETASALAARIGRRFPQAGLCRIAADVEAVSRESVRRAAWCAAPQWGVRAIVFVLTATGLFLLVRLSLLLRVHAASAEMSLSELLQLVYNAVNDTVLAGLALVFVWSWEVRIKRGRTLKALHELRSLAHIIDMHQLTKDPESLLHGKADTQDKPPMTRDDLVRYLIYCSDLQALLGKIAALYAQELADRTVLSAVNEIEELTTALSQKIWQKITLVDPVYRAGGASGASAAGAPVVGM